MCDGGGIADGACDCDGNVEDCTGECGGNAFEDEFKIGGYYANAPIESKTMSEFLEKYRKELTFLATKHIEKIEKSN